MNSVHFITLGCSKNDVDTSQMQSLLNKDKFSVSDVINESDIIVVNTCGFIDSAKEQSIDAIINAARYKEYGNCKNLIIAGCLAQRYPEELMSEIPEIDYIVGTGSFYEINEILEESLRGNRNIKIDNLNNKYLEGTKKEKVNITEYVKISEGCNNNCTYCIIPKLRGKNRSRKLEDIYSEVEYLVGKGAREIILIAQNTTDYGIDIYSDYKLDELIKNISKIKNLKWVRIMYLYPDNITEGLIEEFKNNDKLVKYVDIPLQHISDRILKNMNRHTNKSQFQNIVNKLKDNVDGISIRTTLILGFPGENEEDFNELLEFIKLNKFDKLGAFKYSREEGTPAFSMKNQISDDIKEKRYNEIMELQKNISNNLNYNRLGKIYEVLIEEKIDDNNYIGRAYFDAPDIDGIIYVKSDKIIEKPGFYDVKINDSMEYDLIGELQ
ncbi:Ribosomal protein S12 methylthiotransferase RimO [Peptoniphilus sp. ING2-D1G]|nr:Ribosomal protein S12 methylthiotransferase RimO [Peptoniphilus sp. ING2-D1G]